LRVEAFRLSWALLAAFIGVPNITVAGVITGKVVFAGAVPPPTKLEVTADQYVCGAEKDAGDLLLSARKEITNAVVWLDNPPAGGAAPPTPKDVAIDQKACMYVPRIAMVPVGHTVDFLNSDRLLHNIHAMPKFNASFNRTQPKNRTIPVTFDKPEIIEVTCDLHPWMKAWIVVAAHPFYVITGADGQFAFENLPAGQYRYKAWHERLGTVSGQVTVTDQQPGRVTIEMKVP
jgi:plastocyanin